MRARSAEAISQRTEAFPRLSGLISSEERLGPSAETQAQARTAGSARRKSERDVDGVARTVRTIAVRTAAMNGAMASQALVTPKAVRTVCSSLPSISQSAQVPVPCLPSSG